MTVTVPSPAMYTLRASREREYGVTNYELQAMLEVDHQDWPKHTAEMDLRSSTGIAYTQDEADLAIATIHQWVRESGIEHVRQVLTDTVNDRRNPDGSRRIWLATPRSVA